MAKVAEEIADFIIVTSDNPRTERPVGIIGEIMAGFDYPTEDTIVIEQDRKKAIGLAIKEAAKDDFVLIAGKGHEDYQIIGNEKIQFSDFLTVEDCIKKLKLGFVTAFALAQCS